MTASALNVRCGPLSAEVHETIRRVFHDGLVAASIKPEFRERINDTKRQPVVLQFHEYLLPDMGTVRLTTIEGPGTDIVALMIFPERSGCVPVFGAEIVTFGKIVRAGVIDLQPVGTKSEITEQANVLQDARLADFTDLRAAGPLPGWCEDYFTPEAVFVMGREMEILPRVLEALGVYLEVWKSAAVCHGGVGSPEGSEEMSLYKRHHVVHTPGRPYLVRMFGEDWTERFLAEAMYR